MTEGFKEHPYLGNSQQDVDEMLQYLGLKSIEELYSDIPDEIRFKGELDLPHYKSEYELLEAIKAKMSKNITTREVRTFMGGGVLDIYMPALQDEVLRRTEFYSAYTPYQPETSQGTTQALFEYQSMICELVGMNVANCSLYDWATAVGEAALMASRITKRYKFIYTAATAPNREAVLKNYVVGANLELEEIPYDPATGKMNIAKAKTMMDDTVAGIYIENPNFLGVIEDDLEEIIADAHEKGVKVVVGADMNSLALLKPPGEYGTDICIGEGQTIGGGPLNFGGPLLGILAMQFDRRETRQMPGRIVGVTITANEGERAFANTLETREQHIKRERATSNICTNEGLVALSCAIHLALLGPEGYKDTAETMYLSAHFIVKELEKLGIKRVFDSEFFNTFMLDLKIPKSKKQEFINFMLERKIFPGIPYSNDGENYDYIVTTSYLLCEEDLNDYIKAIGEWRS
ncbi:MAG: aminomethyl-transferring glycine dehydrogenase subunit GcvPA [Candidatus Heimdallarchaeota archaeon]|nr:aminomethyl-transferring glycine dehydrogenase subunit GcvPA [Candidatus Heimdallarchaeota archaeon]MCG3254687.1 aminomethyl-transferring glycine dehydrogenase subunit GcvPA [Candidatus Heimdallarchaeota archaeon]MCK4609768.1 aminomethyl-transferring glycine dehydrogenase subunit GcvPA [Candidatus Heimdallarchaeota archaeon]